MRRSLAKRRALLYDGTPPACGAPSCPRLVHAVRLGLVPRTSADAVETPRMRHVEMLILSAVQACAFLAASHSKRMHALYVMALATRMRQGELLALHWKDVDVAQNEQGCRASASMTCDIAQRRCRSPVTLAGCMYSPSLVLCSFSHPSDVESVIGSNPVGER